MLTDPARERSAAGMVDDTDAHAPLSDTEVAVLRARAAQLRTEDDAPLDNFYSEKQQRLLTEPLYNSWSGPAEGRPFIVAANVGVFPVMRQTPLVPDVFLSLDVAFPEELWEKHHRSYFMWEYGKPPEIVIEIVSNREGDELGRRLQGYERMRVPYYVVFDPERQISDTQLQVFELRGFTYALHPDAWFPSVGLGLTLWRGTHESVTAAWLRWCYEDARLVLTGAERAEQEHQRAEQEHQRAEQEHQRAERLAAKLRELGIDPDTI